MCQITAPPTLFLAGPLQDPGWWLLIVGALAFAMWLVPWHYRRYLRQQPSALYRRAAIILLTGAILCLCTSAVLLVLVVYPSRDALGAWLDRQNVILYASQCADTALFDTYDRQLTGPIATLEHVGNVFLLVGLGAEATWFIWIGRRARAQPAQQ